MKNLKNLVTKVFFTLVMFTTLNISAQGLLTETTKTNSVIIDPIDSVNSAIFGVDADNMIAFGFWDTFLVDAGGALGGAGSVASIISVATAGTGALTPLGWGAVAVGGIIGGASASVAYSKSAPNTNIKDDIKLIVKKENDDVGIGHNQLILDFYKTNSNYKDKNIFDKDAFYEFATANKTYSKEAPKLLKEDYDRIVSESLSLRNKDINGILNYINKYLPKSIEKKTFNKSLLSLSSSKNLSELIINIETLENEIMSKKLSELDSFLMNTFFSTMRHSAILW